MDSRFEQIEKAVQLKTTCLKKCIARTEMRCEQVKQLEANDPKGAPDEQNEIA